MKPYKGEKFHREIVLNNRVDIHRKSIRNALYNHGKKVVEELIRVVTTGPRTGRIYLYRGVPYQASAPGEPPAVRSGDLSRGFRSKPRNKELRIGNIVFSKKGAPYPSYLVTGTSKMAPRPYFLNTITRLHGRLQMNLEKL